MDEWATCPRPAYLTVFLPLIGLLSYYRLKVPMPVGNSKSSFESVKDDPILDLLQREYWALQDKIDKIGGFRFTIKGWALTLNTGALVAAFATSLDRTLGALLVSGLLFGLWYLEWGQLKLTELFQSRSLRIETKISRRLHSLGVRRIEFSTLICSPGIASELRTPIDLHKPTQAAVSPLRRKRGLWHRIVNSSPLARLRRTKLGQRTRHSDMFFYFLLWIISVAFILFYQSHTQPLRNEKPDGHALKLIAIREQSDNFFNAGESWRGPEK